MTRLSVNINKFATLRNSRGGNNPDVVKAAIDAQRFGADGVTVHPRPDERHIRYNDVREIKKIITTEFNIEGNCTEQKFVDLVLETKPDQVTLVPDTLGQLTSDHGWDTIKNKDYLEKYYSGFLKKQVFVFPYLSILILKWLKVLPKPEQTGLNFILKVMQSNLQSAIKQSGSQALCRSCKKSKRTWAGFKCRS